MKRYLVFEFENYYPAGGWNDFKASFDSIEKAKASLPAIGSFSRADYYQIIDSTTGEEVK
jgi:hypothetical protein